ncbi:MAG: SDR family oxidoreductase [bacterium]|nr:SDR family oxidoreductase [bacterium]MBU1918974.1 SDR family oxidoreductase [bacterium]
MEEKQRQYKDKWAVVLGCSSGIGAATVRALVRDHGINIFAMHRGNYQDEADKLANDVRAMDAKIHIVKADAGIPEGVEQGIAELHAVAGDNNVSFFVHSIANASHGRFTGDKSFHPKQFAKTFESMAHSFVYWANWLVARDLLSPGAMLLGLTNPLMDSIINEFGMVSAAKAALDVYIRHLALEMGPLGYRVNLLKFGLVETPAVKEMTGEENWRGIKKRVSAVTPAGRISSLEEVADFISLLMQPAANFFNGATIDFTGGQVQSLVGHVFDPTKIINA